MKPSDAKRGKQAKRAALVIAGTMALWILLQLIGAQYDWAPKYALLIDLAALAGFIWALVITFEIWRLGRDDRA
jgi:hypothetical protein